VVCGFDNLRNDPFFVRQTICPHPAEAVNMISSSIITEVTQLPELSFV
jgi:hypothetical protein